MSTNDITKYAAATDATFGFAGKYGVAAEVVAAPSKQAHEVASQMLASLQVAKSTGIMAAVGGAVSMAALGSLDPLAIGAGAMAGVITTIGGGKGGRG